LPDTEVVDLVDAKDNVIGEATLGECLARGLLHRAVAVLVVRKNRKYVLQVRSRRDSWHPGLLTLSSTGHARKGETFPVAARRELSEELGLTAELRFVKKYLLDPISSGKLTEHEIVCFFTCRTDEPCRVDPGELEGVREVSEPEIRKLIATGPLTPDARIILADYLATM
jgi:isopentenyl-diphosphate Delta-isomerase